jgi:hypothetical protein
MFSDEISNLLRCSRFIQRVLVAWSAVRRMRPVADWESTAVKYALTTLAGLSFGTLSFRISYLLGWNHIGERLFVFAGGLLAAAFLCAPLWA